MNGVPQEPVVYHVFSNALRVVDKNWNMNQHCTLAVQKTISILDCFSKGLTSRSKEMILYPLQLRDLCGSKFWLPSSRNKFSYWSKSSGGRGEYYCKERLGEQAFFKLKKTLSGVFIVNNSLVGRYGTDRATVL